MPAPSPDLAGQRRSRFEHNPWFFAASATPEEKAAQLAHQRMLAETDHVALGASCYVAPSAAVAGHPGASLRMGDRCFVAAHAYVTDAVELGDDCTINPFATLRGRVRGGCGVRIGAYACIVGFNHGFADPDTPIFKQPHTSKGIELGDDIWIGAHATIVDGVKVGSHVVIAAGAVVTKDVPDHAIVGGNPARVIRLRNPAPAAAPARPPGSLEGKLERFGRRVGEQLEDVLKTYRAKLPDGAPAYVNEKGGPLRVRPWCDAVEVAAMFGRVAPGYAAAEWVTRLRDFQDPETGLVSELVPAGPAREPAPAGNPDGAWRYNTMIVNYALECLGSNLARPVANADAITPARLRRHLESLPWSDRAWHCGDWVDCYGSSVLPGARYFGKRPPLAALFAWLDKRCDPMTGLWGSPTPEGRWQQPVNGFYRLTRGTYAQYDRPVPYPERAIDTILAHAGDAAYFGGGRADACHVLDVIHPWWLCRKQTAHRRDEIEAWTRRRLGETLRHWVDGRGFDFVSARKKPGLQGTEMWLSIVWLAADLLGASSALGYRPRGVHRPEPAGRGLAIY